MTPPASSSTTSAFDTYLNQRLQDPEIRTAFDDRGFLREIVDCLVGFRKALGLTQAEIARRMGVKQPTVSGFETEMSDPRLSTLQRYAGAVDARIEVRVHWDAEYGRVTPIAWQSAYRQNHVRFPYSVSQSDSGLLRDWLLSSRRLELVGPQRRQAA